MTKAEALKQLAEMKQQLAEMTKQRDEAQSGEAHLSELFAAEADYFFKLSDSFDYVSLEQALTDRVNLKARLAGNMGGKGHRSNKLQELLQIADKHWSNVDRDAPDTHPKNNDVASDLAVAGWSEKLAKAGASIIRPSWARRGRPEH
jgi:predicted component of type VI protein secretion system